MGYKGQSEPVWGPYLKAPMLWVAGGAEQLSCHDKLMLSYSVGCYCIQLWDMTIYKEDFLKTFDAFMLYGLCVFR